MPFAMRSLLVVSCLAACSLSPDLPERPPLGDMEEPLDLRAEPDDEAARAALPKGTFSGLVVEDARDTLAAKLDQPSSLRIAQIVENSPAAAAGLQIGDVLLEAQVAHGPHRTLLHPSEWRSIELENPAGTSVVLIVDRAGREARTELQLAARIAPAPRAPMEMFREDERVGVVLRTATEVEARAAGLGPGGGAVVIGLSRSSPWRTAGLRFGDLVVAVDTKPVTHPQELLFAIRDRARTTLQLEVVRDGARRTIDAQSSARDSDLNEFSLPLLVSYTSERGASELSLLLGIVNYRSTAAAWRFRLLWLIAIGGGDSDRLLEVDG